MKLSEACISVWQQALADEKPAVQLGRQSFPVTASSKKGLRTVEFTCAGIAVVGIEQNPHTKSAWARLAREGQRIVQFRCQGRYIANVAEGKLTRYPAWHSLNLSE